MFISGLFFILIGLWLFYMKYRIIIGGTRLKAKVIQCDDAPGPGGYYALVVAFKYKGERLQKPLATLTTLFPRRYIGKVIDVYYNEKYPRTVSDKRIIRDVGVLALIIAGLVVIFFL